MFGPLAMRSTQPRAPHGHGSPSRSTLMWPMWPALPVGPGCSLPPRIRPPPTPVETTMHSALSWPCAAPCQCSAAVIATPSPTSSTGRPPVTARTRSTSGKSRQPGTLTGLTVPVEASTGPALPMPTARALAHSGAAVSSRSTSSTARITVSPSSLAGVGRCARRGCGRGRPPGPRRSWCRRCRARRRGRSASGVGLPGRKWQVGEKVDGSVSPASDNVVQGLCSTPHPHTAS